MIELFWEITCIGLVLEYEQYMLYVCFVMDYQKGRLFGSKYLALKVYVLVLLYVGKPSTIT